MTPVPPPEPEEPGIRIALSELEMLLSMITGLMIFTAGALFAGRGDNDVTHRTGGLLWGIAGGLVAYIYTILQMPGTGWVIDLGSWAGVTATLFGAVLTWIVYQLLTGERPRVT
jgi:hypothetical protein